MNIQRRYLAGLIVLLSLVMIPVFVLRGRRPPREAYTAELFQGIVYTRQVHSSPRPLIVHIVEIDLDAPGIRVLVTPGDSSHGLEVPARTTSAFAEEFGVQVAINGGYFKPFRVGNFLFDYYPHEGDPVDVLGLAISGSKTYSLSAEGRPVLCVLKGRAVIRHFDCPIDTVQALAGNRILVENGITSVGNRGLPSPRTAVAVDKTGKTLWLIVVDGRQRNYSEGVTLAELADIAKALGADQALNLDGGGSSTLVIMEGPSPRTINSPIHKRIPMWQRPVANHLGIYAEPLMDMENK
jgi:hypothetical protein